MGKIVPSRLRTVSVAVAATAAVVLSSFLAVQPASADSAPVDPTSPSSPTTVTADSLPAPQINGVVWSQKIVGNIVYAGGNFTTAQPAGAASGVSTVSRTDLLAYNLTTGALITTFAPVLNGQVRSVTTSPDGSRLYIGGSFTTVNGTSVYRTAALDPSTGALISSFIPSINATVNSVIATASTVYVGGGFTAAGGAVRNKVAAFSATTGALLSWAPDAEGGDVQALAMAPDGSKIVIGGSFTTLDGSSNPGYGLGAVDPTSAALLPWNVNNLIRDGGSQASITSLTADADGLYGSGYVFGDGGNLEGSFRADWSSGNLVWVEDCHGDTYSVATTPNAEYIAGHPHYCGNIGGFPQTDPTWTFHRALAFSKAATGTDGTDPYGYYNFAGNPTPTLLDWFPDFNTGTFTGQTQGPWSVAANSQYVVYGGEFTTVNGVRQQGLARFAVSSLATNKQGPMVTGASFVPKVVSLSAGTARVSWTANWDRDNTHLTYNVYRNGGATPVYTTTANSTFWQLPNLGFVDTGLKAGTSYTYRVSATDPFGNTVKGDSSTAVTTTTATTSAYTSAVQNQGASSLWRLAEPSGSTVYDYVGYNDLTAGAGVTRGASGSASDGSAASTFSGDSAGLAATQTAVVGPQTFSVEAWFKTTSTAGGKIVGFGSANTGTSSNYDRHLYMDTSGKVNFGVYNGNTSVVTSPTALNDGTWHQAIGTLSSAGESLYIDGKLVSTRTDATSAQNYSGYWRVGGDSSWSGANYFAGSIDDVSIYPTALTRTQVDTQWVAAGNTTTLAAAPTDSYGNRVYTDNPYLYWRLNDASGATSALDSSPAQSNGLYSGGVTQQAAGALTGVSNKAATFDGSSGQVVSSQAYTDPETYSVEAWFKTTTTTGGKIIGFGSSQTGTSGSYDRHVYLQDDGQLVFGTYTGQENTITSPGAYNDGVWHHVVATQSSDGLKLYVDGSLVGTNAQTQAQAYTGYWKVGGDTTWGSSSAYFNGTIDEVAVYDHALTAATVAQHYALAGGTANQPPVSSFVSTTNGLTASLDGTGSTDPDGTVASYAWDFGDGAQSTGATTSHAYAAAGTYTVTLTVTDNKGAVGTSTQQVTVTAPHVNVAPTASFTSAISNLAVAFDGSASSDPDGTVKSYAWNFGDGTTATTVKPSHTYAAAGSYTVTLTVTDDQGATGTSSAKVTVAAAPVNVAPTASFVSTVTNLGAAFDASASNDPDGSIVSYGWSYGDGTSGTGSSSTHTYTTAGTYTVTLTVTDNAGATGTSTQKVTVAPPANVPPTSTFTSSAKELVLSVDAGASKDSDGAIASYAWDFGDGGTASGVTATHTYASAGSYTVKLTVTDNAGASTVSTQTVTVAAHVNVAPVASFTATPTGLVAAFDASASSDSDGTVASYAWNFGDGTTGTGVKPSHTYTNAGSYSVQLTVTDNSGGTGTATQAVTVAPAANVPPTAAFTSTITGLSVATDASGSTDPDGTIASYAWNFGDGGTATGKTATHAYTTAGTYTVSLTVTDNGGATAVTTNTVTVSVPAVVPFALDNFGRTVTAGWGTADTGGAWTKPASALAVKSGSGTITLSSGGQQTAEYLSSVSQTSTDLLFTFNDSKAATGGGTYVSAIGRSVNTSTEYRAQVRLQSNGAVGLSLLAYKGSSTATTLVAEKNIAGLTAAAGTNFTVRLEVTGTNPTTVRAKVWATGGTEPTAWAETATDTYAALQAPGSIGVLTYLSGSATNTPQIVSFSQLSAFKP